MSFPPTLHRDTCKVFIILFFAGDLDPFPAFLPDGEQPRAVSYKGCVKAERAAAPARNRAVGTAVPWWVPSKDLVPLWPLVELI